jgi:hypothetical protein
MATPSGPASHVFRAVAPGCYCLCGEWDVDDVEFVCHHGMAYPGLFVVPPGVMYVIDSAV